MLTAIVTFGLALKLWHIGAPLGRAVVAVPEEMDAAGTDWAAAGVTSSGPTIRRGR